MAKPSTAPIIRLWPTTTPATTTRTRSPRTPTGDKLAIALALILGLMAVEVVVGIVAHSLALLSDAGHMLTDAGAIGFSLVAIRLAQRPAEGAMTFGLKRAEILSAQANGITLLILALFIVYEAIHRLVSPPDVDARPGARGRPVRGRREPGRRRWMLSGRTARASTSRAPSSTSSPTCSPSSAPRSPAIVILLTGFDRADAIASLLVAALMLRSSYGLLASVGTDLPGGGAGGNRPESDRQRAGRASPASSRSTTCTSGR